MIISYRWVIGYAARAYEFLHSRFLLVLHLAAPSVSLARMNHASTGRVT